MPKKTALKKKGASNSKGNLETATFGAGCFWGIEEMYRVTSGVKETAVGYMGGKMPSPKYEDVCSDETGHAEVVQVKFNPKEISYENLLDLFWKNHNPTILNRQGPDIGTQYRSVVFYQSPEQKKIAEKSKEAQEKNGKWAGRNIVTQIVPAETFWPAEDYHQKYLMKRGLDSCHI